MKQILFSVLTTPSFGLSPSFTTWVSDECDLPPLQYTGRCVCFGHSEDAKQLNIPAGDAPSTTAKIPICLTVERVAAEKRR